MYIHVQCFPQSMEVWQLSTLRDMSNTSEQSIACACVHDYTAVWPRLYSTCTCTWTYPIFSMQTVVNFIILCGSVLITFVFNYVYCAIDSQQKFMDTYWVMQATSTRPQYWFLLLLAPVVCLIPRSVGQ